MISSRKGNKYIFFVLLFFILGQIAISILLSPYTDEFSPILKLGLNTFFVQFLFILLPLIIYLIFTKQSIKETLKLKKLSIYSIFIIILLGIMIQPISIVLNIFSQLYSNNEVSAYIGDFKDLPFYILLFFFAVVPAINEELTMRGLLLHHYKFVTPVKAALVSGLFFGIIHLNLNQFTYAVALGFVFSIVVMITDSIFSSIIMHFILNATSVTLMKFINVASVEGTETVLSKKDILFILPVYMIIAIPFIVIVYALLYLLAEANGKVTLTGKKRILLNQEDISDSPFYSKQNSKIIDVYFIMIIMLFVALQILQIVASLGS